MLYTCLNRTRNSINVISARSHGYPGQFNLTATSVIKRLGSDLGQICTWTFTFLWPEDVVNQPQDRAIDLSGGKWGEREIY